MAMTATQQQDAYNFFIIAFGAAPGVVYMDQLNDAYAAGMTTKQIVNVYTTKPQFTALYPNFLSNSAFANSLVDNVVKSSATDAAKAEAVADIEAALASGMTRGDVIYQVFTNLANKPQTDATWGNTAKLFANEVAVAKYYTETLLGSSTDVATLQAVVSGVTAASDVSSPAAIAALLTGTFTLTNNIDVQTAHVFTSTPVYVPGGNDFINSLQDEDKLTGTAATDDRLNVTLGSVNDAAESTIVPTLTSIEIVNVEVTGSTAGINFQDATGTNTINVNRITQTNAVVTFDDLKAEVTNLSVNNATRDGTVNFLYKEEVLTSNADVLALAVNNARLKALNLAEGTDSGADAGFFFEDINLTTSGNNDLDAVKVQANGREDLLLGVDAGTTKQSLDIVANGTASTGSLEINKLTANGVDAMSIVANARVVIAKDKLLALDDSNDGIRTADLETLTITGAANVMIDGLDTNKQDHSNGNVTLTVNAGAMTGNLKLGVDTASDSDNSGVYLYRADKDLSVTSGSGNDEIRTYGKLAGDISTGEGNDIVAIRDASNDADANVEGVSTIDAGNGINTVSAQDLLVTAADANQVLNTGYDDVTAARIITGSGVDTVTVRDLTSGLDWDNKSLVDSNADDLYQLIGASVSTGAGNDVIAARKLAEGAMIDAGEGDDVVNVSINPLAANSTSFNPSNHTVLAGDTDADQQTVKTTANNGTREVTSGEVADRLGAVLDLGAGTADVANFAETTSLGANTVTIVGRDAELRGAETVNVTALDRITVTTTTSMADQDALTALVQTDINANVIGTQHLNLTIANQINAATAGVTGLVQNDTNIFNTNAVITADVMRFDSSLQDINLVSQEQTLLLNPATENYEAGTRTNFELQNMREGVALSLQANEATGVTAGALVDDTLLAINTTTGLVTSNANAADVRLDINYANARGLNDAAVLNVAAASGAFDLDLHIGATTTDTSATNAAGNNGAATSATDDDTMRFENFAVKFADANSHSINANGFGDVVFRGATARPATVAGDVSSTAATSFTVWSGAGAGQSIAIDAVNADTISVRNVDGTAVSNANVTVRVDASNNYSITTGAGTDLLDLRADDVRSDDTVSALIRADNINAGTGRDTLIVNGGDDLGVNNNIEGGVASTIIDDDVFATIRGVEKILVDSDVGAANTNRITLDEQATITGVDTIAVVGSGVQTTNIELGNNFVLATDVVDNANGKLTLAAAFVIDASLHTGGTTLNIESKDDDTDIALINLDIRANSKGGDAITLVNSGSQTAAVELRVFTADENDTFNAHSGAAAIGTDGDVAINVTTGSFDKLVVLENANADNGGAEGAMTIALAAGWTDAAFEVDASAVQDTDANVATGGASISAAVGDTAVLTLKGTQNSDTITGGRGADTIDGNAGNDTITGDEVVNNNELEVVTFAATYDAGDVVSVTHVTALGVIQTLTATVSADNTAGAAIAEALAAFDNTGAAAIAGVTVAGARFSDATSTFDGLTRQLRLTGATAGTDYAVSATTDNAKDNTAQVQTLSINDSNSNGVYTVQIVFNGITYTIQDNAVPDLSTLGTYAALDTAVTTLGGTLSHSDNIGSGPDIITIKGPSSGAAFPQITQAIQVGTAEAVTLTLSLTPGTLGTDQADPTVVTETLARTVLGGADTINGGAGNDTIAGLTGADKLDGGDGVDTLDYSLSLGGVTVNLASNTASGGDAAGDTISNFENVTGSAYNDTLTGSDAANTLIGGAGNDVLSGGASIDTLNGGVGADTITGGAGNDIIILGVDAVEDTVVFASGDGVDTISNFVAGTDTIRFSDFADRDLLSTSLLHQIGAGVGNVALSGGNTELLVVTGAVIAAGTEAANIATAIGGAFDLTTLVDGRVMFSVQSAAASYIGYYTDSGNDDVINAAEIEVIATVVGTNNVGSADFWLPTV